MRASQNGYLAQSSFNAYQWALLEQVALWAAFYRANPHRWVMDFLHVKLRLFQMIVLYMMDLAATSVFIGARGIGKTFLAAILCCHRCVNYPGSKIVIASGTRGQGILVIEKIMKDLVPNSPELRAEIDEKATRINSSEAVMVFKNGSYIEVVTASDTARGHRATMLLVDEFPLVKKDTVDAVLRKFLASPRHPKYLDYPEYENDPDLQERNKLMFLSSAYYTDHWSYTRCTDSCRFMLSPEKSSFICGLPYQLSIQEGLLLPEDVEEEQMESDFNEVKFSMEREAIFFGSSDDAFFDFESVSKNRHIEYAMLPDDISIKLPKATKLRIQTKQPGEKRILSADIALMASTKKKKNDATAIFINSLTPTKAGRLVSNIVYAENNEGMRTEEQALRIRKLFDAYDCDYLVLDAKSMGLSIYDALAKDMPDPDTGEVYPALSCCNNDDLAARCVSRNAPKVIWAMLGNAKFNSDCALLLREGFRSGRIRLLITEDDLDGVLGDMREYNALSVADKVALKLPYINTTLLIAELINLQHEESTGLVRISEKPGARKDRYSSLSYNFWVANQIEHEQLKKGVRIGVKDNAPSFIFRAPGSKRDEERW